MQACNRPASRLLATVAKAGDCTSHARSRLSLVRATLDHVQIRLSSPASSLRSSGEDRSRTLGVHNDEPYTPTRTLKATRISPNQQLQPVLSRVPGCQDLYYHFNTGTKPDLSYIDVREYLTGNALYPSLSVLAPAANRARSEASRRTLQGIVIDIVERCLSVSVEPGDFTDEHVHPSDIARLRLHDYTIEDARRWIRILTATTSEEAVDIIIQAESLAAADGVGTRPVPVFVLLMTLKRRRVSAKALLQLLMSCSARIGRRSLSAGSAHTTVDRNHSRALAGKIFKTRRDVLDDTSSILIITRLLRHARSVWPESIPFIAKLFVELMKRSTIMASTLGSTVRQERYARAEMLYNSMLRLLAIPTALDPASNADILQQAQFHLLRAMGDMASKQIDLHRSTYRALMSVQLALGKSPLEKDWARLKARSWPPYMDPKMGDDEKKTPEHGKSRTTAMLERMREAGYGSSSRDHAAQVMAGWDIENSPSIQTRVANLTSELRLLRQHYRIDPLAGVWAARIRTTRTVDEAWALFLEYVDASSEPTPPVHLQMLEKLYRERQRKEGRTGSVAKETTSVFAGDSKALFTPPRSPREATYTRTSPPSYHDFAMQILRDERMQLGRRDMAFVIRSAGSLEHGVMYAMLGTQDSVQLARCLQGTQSIKEVDSKSVSPKLLDAFVQLLSLAPGQAETPTWAFLSGSQDDKADVDHNVRHRPAGIVALALIDHLAPAYRPCWHHVFVAINKPSMSGGARSKIANYAAVKKRVQRMDTLGVGTDLETLRLACMSLSKAADAWRSLSGSVCKSSDVVEEASSRRSAYHEPVVDASFNALEESDFVKGWFYLLVHGSTTPEAYTPSSDNDLRGQLPTLLVTPSGAEMHQYIRTLGVLRDWSGLLDATRWVFAHRRELVSYNSRNNNGLLLVRKAMVAIRAAAEGRLSSVSPAEDEKCPAEIQTALQTLMQLPTPTPRDEHALHPQMLAEDIQPIFQWPSEDELYEYWAAG